MMRLPEIVVCHDCKLTHRVAPGSREAEEFLHRHHNHHCELVDAKLLLTRLRDRLGDELYKKLAGVFFDIPLLPYSAYRGNANVKEAFGTATNFTKTNANLATSATAGWKGNAIDNTSNLYLDALVNAEYAAVNTAPANSKAIFFYASSYDGTNYTNTGAAAIDGNEGTVTFPDITSLSPVPPLLGVVPYPTQNIALNGPMFSVARCFGGILPPKWCISKINHSGMTLSTTNLIYIEVYNTVV